MFTLAFFQRASSHRVAGRGCSAGLSLVSKADRRQPSSFWKGRLLSFSGRIAALGDQDPCLDLGLVTGLASASRDDGDGIVLGELSVGRINLGVVAIGAADGAAQLIRHGDLGHAPDEFEGPHRGGAEILELLRPRRLGVGVVRGAQLRSRKARPRSPRRCSGIQMLSFLPE
jgi:hypothetical protein